VGATGWSAGHQPSKSSSSTVTKVPMFPSGHHTSITPRELEEGVIDPLKHQVPSNNRRVHDLKFCTTLLSFSSTEGPKPLESDCQGVCHSWDFFLFGD
jgi:hypothetical protein